MNNFTKEELETILYSIDIVSNHEDTDQEQLFNKIKSMIDNYCEHEWGEFDNHYCIKCKREF